MDVQAWLVVAAVVAAAFGVFGAWVAGQKGRRADEGLILGVLFGPLGVLVEAVLPARTPQPGRTPAARAIGPAPGPVRPRRSLRDDDADISDADTPAGWRKMRRLLTGEVFYTPAPEPEPEPEPAGVKRWERPLRRLDAESEGRASPTEEYPAGH